MSIRRISARAMALVVAATAALIALAPAAHAGSPMDVCEAFPHKQTYTDDGFFRAPAWRYGGTVTIVYETDSCTGELTESGAYLLSLSGTATVYEGEKPEGRPIDKRLFSSVIRSDSDGETGWPIRWWSCFKGDFSYVWSIPNVYTFGVSATDGEWLMYQREEPKGESSVTTFDGCRAEERRTP